jgi:hypothetical protein
MQNVFLSLKQLEDEEGVLRWYDGTIVSHSREKASGILFNHIDFKDGGTEVLIMMDDDEMGIEDVKVVEDVKIVEDVKFINERPTRKRAAAVVPVPTYPVGTKLKTKFKDKKGVLRWYKGSVVSHSHKIKTGKWLNHIEYDDGDSEKMDDDAMDSEEVTILKPALKRKHKSSVNDQTEPSASEKQNILTWDESYEDLKAYLVRNGIECMKGARNLNKETDVVACASPSCNI